jgi:hypothetical protein
MIFVNRFKAGKLSARLSLVAGALGIVGLIGFGAVSAAPDTITGTGYGSTNSITDSTITTTITKNTNDLSVDNTNNQSSSTGSSNTSGNTTGGSSTSGSSTNSSTSDTDIIVNNY